MEGQESAPSCTRLVLAAKQQMEERPKVLVSRRPVVPPSRSGCSTKNEPFVDGLAVENVSESLPDVRPQEFSKRFSFQASQGAYHISSSSSSSWTHLEYRTSSEMTPMPPVFFAAGRSREFAGRSTRDAHPRRERGTRCRASSATRLRRKDRA